MTWNALVHGYSRARNPIVMAAGTGGGQRDRCVHRRGCTGPGHVRVRVARRRANAAMNPSVGVVRGNAEITRHTKPFSQRSIVDVELDQRLGMVRDERNGHDQHGHAVVRRACDFRLRARSDPGLRCRARLIADDRVGRLVPALPHMRDGLLDLPTGTGRRPARSVPAARARKTAREDLSPVPTAPGPHATPRAATRRSPQYRPHRSDNSTAWWYPPPTRLARPPRATLSPSCQWSWWNAAGTAAAARPHPASSRARLSRSQR